MVRELAVLTFQSLDGVMQGPTSPDEDPSGGFDRGGWGMPYWEQVMALVGEEAMNAPYDMLFGRTTYDMFAANWPSQGDDNEVAKMMNAARKYVVTSSSNNDISWTNTQRIAGTPVEVVTQIKQLKQTPGPLLQVHGSHGLLQTLLQHGLIDEFRLWTFPVLLGSGKKLFERNDVTQSLKLKKTRTTQQGVVMGIYRHN